MRRVDFFAVVLVCLGFFTTGSYVFAQGLPATLIMGAALDHMLDQAQQAIDDGRNTGSSVEAKAGREAVIAINKLQAAYQDSLDVTIGKLDPVITNRLNQVESALDGVEAQTNSDLQKLTTQLNVAVRNLPFRQHQPQLTSVTPLSIVATKDANIVRITFNGSFEESSRPGFEPFLWDGRHAFVLDVISTTQLRADLPIELLLSAKGSSGAKIPDQLPKAPLKISTPGSNPTAPQLRRVDLTDLIKQAQAQLADFPLLKLNTIDAASNANLIFPLNNSCPANNTIPIATERIMHRGQSYRLKLVVPWRQSNALGLTHSRKTSHFDVVVDRLPPTPGRLTVYYTTKDSRAAFKQFSSGPYHQASTKEAGNQDHKDVPYSITPDLGWHVVRNTSQLVVASEQGVVSKTFQGDDGDHVIYNVTTIHKNAGSSGSIDFDIKFLETTNVKCDRNKAKAYYLEWGDSQAIIPDIAKTTWVLQYNSFDGKLHSISGNDRNNPYVHVVTEGSTPTIVVTDASAISWPQSN